MTWAVQHHFRPGHFHRIPQSKSAVARPTFSDAFGLPTMPGMGLGWAGPNTWRFKAKVSWSRKSQKISQIHIISFLDNAYSIIQQLV